MRQISAFKCQVVSPMVLHNNLVYAYETRKALEVLIFNISYTSELTVPDQELADLKETKRVEDFISVEDSSSNQTFTDGGAISASNDNLGFFRCKALDLSKLVTSKPNL